MSTPCCQSAACKKSSSLPNCDTYNLRKPSQIKSWRPQKQAGRRVRAGCKVSKNVAVCRPLCNAPAPCDCGACYPDCNDDAECSDSCVTRDLPPVCYPTECKETKTNPCCCCPSYQDGDCCDCACTPTPTPDCCPLDSCKAPRQVKLEKLEFIDPCDCTLCRWSISPDNCGSDSLLVQFDGCDKALLDADGNLHLLGKIEATQLCVAPTEEHPDKQWRVAQNTVSGALQFDCVETASPLPSDATTPETVQITKSGVVVQSTATVTFTGAFNCFTLETDTLPATVIVLNPSLLVGKKLKVPAGSVNGQMINIAHAHAVDMDICFEGAVAPPLVLSGPTLLSAVWSADAAMWIASTN